MLCPVLDHLVDSQNYGLACALLVLCTLISIAMRVSFDKNFPSLAAHSVIMKLLDACQPYFIEPHKAKHVCGQRPVRIKPLWLLAHVYAF